MANAYCVPNSSDFSHSFLTTTWGRYCCSFHFYSRRSWCLERKISPQVHTPSEWCSMCDSGSHPFGPNALRQYLLSAHALNAVMGGRAMCSGMSRVHRPPQNGKTNWPWYLQFSKIVQSSESIDRYGSNLIVLQAPVKMIIKGKTWGKGVSVLQEWKEFCRWMVVMVVQKCGWA